MISYLKILHSISIITCFSLIFYIWFFLSKEEEYLLLSKSTTPLNVDYGEKTFTTDKRIVYDINNKIRLSYSKDLGEIWMEGLITNVTLDDNKKLITFDVTNKKGEGTYKNWILGNFYEYNNSLITTINYNNEEEDFTFGGYDVFLIAGQSNAVGWNSGQQDTLLDMVDSKIYQYGCAEGTVYYDKIVPASEPLKWPVTNASAVYGTSVSSMLTFSKKYVNGDFFDQRRKVLIVPVAYAGSGLVGSGLFWGVGDTFYSNAVSQANKAMATDSGNVFKGVVWVQGETDAQNGVSTSTYSSHFDSMINGMRSEITKATNSAFVVVSMVPEWIATSSNYIAVDDSHATVHQRHYLSYYTRGPSNSNNGGGDIIHYNAAGQRAIGELAYTAYVNALDNTNNRVMAPNISLHTNTYYGTQSVVLTTLTSGSTIYYTLNGTTPTTSSTLYTSSFNIASTTTIKAIAVKTGMTSSIVTTSVLTIVTVVADPTFNPAAGTHSGSQSVTISSTTPSAVIYYSIDGSVPSVLYSSAVTVSSSLTLKAIATRSGLTSSQIVSGAYTINPVSFTTCKNTDSVVDNGGGAGQLMTIRNLIEYSQMTFPAENITSVKFKTRGHIRAMYIGHQASAGDSFDSDSPVQVLFSGSGTQLSTTAEIDSDVVSFAWNKTKKLLINVVIFQSDPFYSWNAGSWSTGYYKFNVQEAQTADVTGYTPINDRIYTVKTIYAA